ncbi:MAG: hypothetical protein JNL30_02270 [Rubrivivax sp.]|nr:hypothetical protein [Rubrivivax sp.]
MTLATSSHDESAARVLALMTAANGRVKDCELQTLARLDAFGQLGVSRHRFLHLAQRALDDVGGRMAERGSLHVADLLYLDHLLEGVHDRRQRLLVCQLAGAVIAADGRISPAERDAYGRLRARWRLGEPTTALPAARLRPLAPRGAHPLHRHPAPGRPIRLAEGNATMKTAAHRPHDESAARVLALIVSANGHLDARELGRLGELGAFALLGLSRKRFEALASACLRDVGTHLGECSWLRASEMRYIDDLLDAVADPATRLLVCRLAAAVVTADGRVSEDERLVYQHMLMRWHIDDQMVTRAILDAGAA